jgi:hypothetical protein
MSDVHEFEELNPIELHLVGAAANKFTTVLAKSAPKKKGNKPKMSKQDKILKALTNEGARPGAHPFAALEARVDRAQFDLAKASDDYALARAREELRTAKHQLTTMKMIAAEGARERDPQMTSRALRGQGVPLLTNRRALPDDASLRGI